MPDRPDNTHSSRTDDSTHSPTSPPPDCTTTPTRWSGSPETSLPRTSTSESPFSHASPSPSYLRQPSHHLPLSIILHVILVISHFRLLSRLLFHRFRIDSIAQLQLPPPHFLQLALPLLHLPLQQRYASFSALSLTRRRRLRLHVHAAALLAGLPRELLRPPEVLHLARRAHEALARVVRPLLRELRLAAAHAARSRVCQ